ncbi:unnamed protein product, partial [Effrenium voratum]
MIPGGFAYKAALEKFQGNAPLRAWNAGISAASKSRRWERGLGLAEALRQAALQASVVTHTAVINARPGRWRCASLLIGRIRRSGLQLDLIALGAFVASLEKGFQWRRALHRFGLATCWGLTPDRILYNSAISACEKCGAWSTAVALATTGMADVVSFTAAISACEKGGRWRVGISLLRALPARFLRPGVIGCNAAISACDKGGAWAHVMSIVRTFVKRDVAPDIISHTACFGAARSWERAMLLLSLLFSRSL